MSNYKAFVCKIERVVPIPKADKIHTAYVMGEQVVVAKDWLPGMIGLFFPADTQLSEDFCKFNNLYRDSQNNDDNTKKGFFENNRKVRCQPFLGVKSEGFFCRIESLKYLQGDKIVPAFSVGESFDTYNGVEICKKYISPQTAKALANKAKYGTKKLKDFSTPDFKKHVDTQQLKYYIDKIEKGTEIFFHAKVHGTSARMGLTKVVRIKHLGFLNNILDFMNNYKRKMLGKILFKLRVDDLISYLSKKLPTTEDYEYVVGTRNVVLNNKEKEGFHGSEQFRFDVMESLKPHLVRGMTVYGEIAGYANGKPIMGVHSTDCLKDKNFKKKYGKEITYKYLCEPDELRFHIYRITLKDGDGDDIEFNQRELDRFCQISGLIPPHEIHPPLIYDGDKEKLEEIVYRLTERDELLTEDYIDSSHISEGIILRCEDYIDGRPKVDFYKNKSYAFKVMEGIFKEKNEDLEDAS